MPSISNSLIPPTLSDGFCNSKPQDQVNEIIGGTQINSDTAFDNLIVSQTTPGVNDRSKGWLRLEADNTPDRLYGFYQGAWAAKHPVHALSPYRALYVGSEASLWSFDGGDGSDPSANPPSAINGAMWEVDHAFDGLFPVGAGTMKPSTTSVSIGETGGADQITLSSNNTPDHTHLGKAYYRIYYGPETTDPSGLYQKPPRFVPFHGDSGHTYSQYYADNWDYAGVLTLSPRSPFGEPFRSAPPYIGVYFIKRTARTHYIAASSQGGMTNTFAQIIHGNLGVGGNPNGNVTGYRNLLYINDDDGNKWIFSGVDGQNIGWI